MTNGSHLIYVSPTNEQAAPPAGGDPFRCCPPDELVDAALLNDAKQIILDANALGARSIGIARRLRWLGYAGPVHLTSSGGSELDRAIARESGVTDFVAASLDFRRDTNGNAQGAHKKRRPVQEGRPRIDTAPGTTAS